MILLEIKDQDLPEKVNLTRMTKVISQRLNVDSDKIELTFFAGGEVDTFRLGEGRGKETIERKLVIKIDGEANIDQVKRIIKDHAPEKTEEEDLEDEKEKALENHPVIKRILNRIKKLEDKI